MQGSKRDTDAKYRLLDSVGEGKGGTICENSIKTGILPYIKQVTSESLISEAASSKLVVWDTPQDWSGEGGGWEVQDGRRKNVYPWLIYADVWQKPPQYCKIFIPQ